MSGARVILEKKVIALKHFCSTDEIRPRLNGVWIDTTGRAYATNGHILGSTQTKIIPKKPIFIELFVLKGLKNNDYIVNTRDGELFLSTTLGEVRLHDHGLKLLEFDELFSDRDPEPLKEIRFNPDYMGVFGKYLKGTGCRDRNLKVEFTGALEPIRVTLASDETFKGLLMPMRG